MNITEHIHYRCWSNIVQRCYNENDANFKHYGGRGITMSNEFRNSSALFCAYLDSLPGWAPGMSIDRIDNDRGYERGNLRWATKKQQANNRRKQKRYGKGYCWHKRDRKWEVQWRVDGKQCHYGSYKTEAEARERARETCPGEYPYPRTI